MAIQILGQDGASVVQVDPTFDAARVSLRPIEVKGWHSVAAKSGNLTTAVAAGAVFSFRNLSAKPILVRRVGVGFVLTTAFTTAQLMEFGLMFCRPWTVSSTGGTAIPFTGSNTKVRTSLETPTSLDARIATTGAITGETKTRDGNYLGLIGGWAGAVGTILPPSLNNLYSHDTGDYPLVLDQNEGISIENVVLMGAAGVGVLYVNMEFAEADAY